MSHTKKLFLLLSIFSLIMIIYFIFSLEYKIPLKKVKRKLENNEKLFLKSVNELFIQDGFVLEKNFLNFTLVENSDFSEKKNIYYSNIEYKANLKLMRKAGIKEINTYSNNIQYVLHSNAPTTQSISYIENMDDFKKYHVIINIILIKDNWYYVEET